jgi:hypothetical protein
MTQRGQRTKINPIDEASGMDIKTAVLSTEKTSTIECKVVGTYRNQSIIDFDGYGILLDGEITFDKVLVTYKGEIGQPDFEIISAEVKEV